MDNEATTCDCYIPKPNKINVSACVHAITIKTLSYATILHEVTGDSLARPHPVTSKCQMSRDDYHREKYASFPGVYCGYTQLYAAYEHR